MPEFKLNGKTYSGSTNYASAISYTEDDGSKTTVQDKISELDYRPVNNNLLINSNFANPVNQRGLNAYNWMSQYGGYCIDRWRLSCKSDEDVTVTINNGYINFIQTGTGDGKFGFLEQRVEFPTKYSGKTLTFSIKYRVNSKSDKLKPIFLEDGKSTSYDVLICDGKWHTFSVKHTLGTITDWFSVAIWGEQEFNIDLEWAKLELGEVATPYVPRLYHEELELCQCFYQSLTTLDVKFYQIGDNIIHFSKEIKPMRVNPTVKFSSDMTLRTALGNVQDGFTFESTFSGISFFNMRAVKINHGMTVSNYPLLYGSVVLDAEL